MIIRCPYCDNEYEDFLLKDGQKFTCRCGRELDEQVISELSYLSKILENSEVCREENNLLRIKILSERIVSYILDPDFPDIDIEIEKANLRELIKELFPNRANLYNLIYETRFERISKQFRDKI